MDTSIKITKHSHRRIVIGAIIAALICLPLFFYLAFFRPSPSPPAPASLYFTLLGDPAWVENRDWQIDSNTRQISHPDWTTVFVLPPETLRATTSPLTFYLDKNLDNFVLAWSQNVQRHQWQKLWQAAAPASRQDLAYDSISARLNAWTRSLLTKELTIDTVQFYLPLASGTAAAPNYELTAVWTIRHADDRTTLITTPLIINWDAPTQSYVWEFNLASLPLFEE